MLLRVVIPVSKFKMLEKIQDLKGQLHIAIKTAPRGSGEYFFRLLSCLEGPRGIGSDIKFPVFSDLGLLLNLD